MSAKQNDTLCLTNTPLLEYEMCNSEVKFMDSDKKSDKNLNISSVFFLFVCYCVNPVICTQQKT